MLGLSYGELFLITRATAALIGPKDLPRIARVAGKLSGRSYGYVQMARGQFDNAMQHSQANQLHKELQDTIAQLEVIRHEMRTLSFVNPGPMTRRLVDNITQNPEANGSTDLKNPSVDAPQTPSVPTFTPKVYSSMTTSARGQFDNVMQQSQAKQVHKELQDAIAQLEAIRHELSFRNPGPLTRRLVDNSTQNPEANGSTDLEKPSDDAPQTPSVTTFAPKVYSSMTTSARGQFDIVMQQSQAKQVHKELQDAIAQLEAIRHELSFRNPGPLTRRLVDNSTQNPEANGSTDLEKPSDDAPQTPSVTTFAPKVYSSMTTSARGQFDIVMQQSQAKQVHKELQDAIAQLEAIRHELSFQNPGPLTRRLVDNSTQNPEANGSTDLENPSEDAPRTPSVPTFAPKVYSSMTTLAASHSSDMHSQATAFARLAESAAVRSDLTSNEVMTKLTDESGLMVLPVSAQESGMLPDRKADANGSDIMLESILEAELARKAKVYFAQPQNLNKSE